MGKMRKMKDKPEGFALPAFNEKEFLVREILESKMLLVSSIYGVIVGIAAGAATISTAGALAPVVGALGVGLVIGLYFLFRLLGWDPLLIEKGKWAANGAGYLTTFLTIWILLINPPLADFVAPEILFTTPGVQELGGNIRITGRISDNFRVATTEATWTGPDGTPGGPVPMLLGPEHVWQVVLPVTTPGTVSYSVRVEDSTGRAATGTGSFVVRAYEAPVITAFELEGRTVGKGDTVPFRISDNVRVVYAWYAWDVDANRTWYTHESTVEKTLKVSSTGTAEITVPSMTGGPHTLGVCATDGLPGSRTCMVWNVRYT